jgi:hypothetical protein
VRCCYNARCAGRPAGSLQVLTCSNLSGSVRARKREGRVRDSAACELRACCEYATKEGRMGPFVGVYLFFKRTK